MEEKQLQDFVHRASVSEELRKELASSPDSVIAREGFSPRLAKVVMRLVPQLGMEKPLEPSLGWWWWG